MKLAIPKETGDSETRVAASPETVKKLVGLGFDVMMEAGAGARSHFPDKDFSDAGAKVASSASEVLGDADVVFMVGRPDDNQISGMKKGTFLASILAPYGAHDYIQKFADAGINAFAMEFMPRITRAQSMDVLSSQSNLAGYKAVIDAAAVFGRAMPMMMTAAGTIAPARVLVMGAGVAGLQAIATAKRLGAIVSATDVRPAVKEQVESLGGKFLEVESDETEDAETAGGYAKEMSEDYKRKQAELIAKEVARQDIIICTALIPGKPAPVLITQEMVETMKPGSVVVDLAVERGGNCPLSKLGETVEHGGVKIMGHENIPGRLATDASALYAKNLLNFITPLVDQETKALNIDWEDEIIVGTALTKDGQMVHASLTGGQ